MIDVAGPLLVVGAQPCSRVIAHLDHTSAHIIDLMGPKGLGIAGKLIIDIRIGRKLGLERLSPNSSVTIVLSLFLHFVPCILSP